jgi:hypothetical protein
MPHKTVDFTWFGETRSVRAQLHNMTAEDTPDEVILVERPEDWYALMSPQFKDKKVAVVTREEWLRYD